MGKSLGKKQRKRRDGIRKFLEMNVKQANRLGRFIEVSFGMKGAWHILYIFGPKTSGKQRRAALSKCVEILMNEDIDFWATVDHKDYPVDAGSRKNNIVLYGPQRIIEFYNSRLNERPKKDPAGISLHKAFVALKMTKPQFVASLIELHNHNVIRVAPTGHIWYKEWLAELAPDFITAPHVHPKLL